MYNLTKFVRRCINFCCHYTGFPCTAAEKANSSVYNLLNIRVLYVINRTWKNFELSPLKPELV
jgi:hypothetical protein